MITNVFFATTILFLALFFLLLQECAFLIAYRNLLLAKYGSVIAGFAAVLFLNLFALMYIASLLNNLFGRGKEPFWQQAYTNLVKFIILLHKVLYDYVTLFDVYACAINPKLLQRKIFEKDQAESLQRALVRELGADLAATDSSRVLRLPGFYNHKYAKPH